MGCTHSLLPIVNADRSSELGIAIASLSGSINKEDARLVSKVLVVSTTELAASYRMTSPPRAHNLLVHMGLKERGLCCHWAEDLRLRLSTLKQESLKFDWLVAHQGRPLAEHNGIVVYGVDSTWKQGLVFDPWRKAGQPYWVLVETDQYPWQLHPLNGQWDLLHCK